MFNQQKNAVWARIAAWGEWFGVSAMRRTAVDPRTGRAVVNITVTDGLEWSPLCRFPLPPSGAETSLTWGHQGGRDTGQDDEA
jgi:hypothetical protein